MRAELNLAGLEEALRLIVREEVERARGSDASSWLDVDGAAEYLVMTPGAVRALVKKHEIPFHKIGARLRFHCDELDAWIRQGERA